MAPATRSRRPLPRRVYWFRRLMVAGVAIVLVLGIAQLLDWSTDGAGGEQAASVSAAPEEPSASDDAKPLRKTSARKKAERGGKDRKDRLARPDGRCADEDVLVTPTITDAHAGSPVKIVLEVTTAKAAACHWKVSPESVFVNIDSESGTVWSSQQCPDAVPTESVVPRRERAAKVRLWWNGKESDEGCTSWTPWVYSGSYTAVAAARGSVTPVATGFLLGSAVAPTITTTPTPTPSETGSATPSDDATPERRRERDRDRDR